jgi:dihydrofolate reductase
MRKIRYAVAMSLDGYIAGRNDEADWIVMSDQKAATEYFTSFVAEFDTVVIGGRTWEFMARGNSQAEYPGLRTYVLSRTLSPHTYPKVTVFGEDGITKIAALREIPGKDIWLFGGGNLFGSFAAANLVDTVELGIFPVILGEGKPLMSGYMGRVNLELTNVKRNDIGCLSIRYSVRRK